MARAQRVAFRGLDRSILRKLQNALYSTTKMDTRRDERSAREGRTVKVLLSTVRLQRCLTDLLARVEVALGEGE